MILKKPVFDDFKQTLNNEILTIYISPTRHNILSVEEIDIDYHPDASYEISLPDGRKFQQNHIILIDEFKFTNPSKIIIEITYTGTENWTCHGWVRGEEYIMGYEPSIWDLIKRLIGWK